MGALNEILAYLLQTLLSLFLLLVMLRFLLQLVRADFYNPISQFLVKVTNPIILPLRKVVPGLWGLDMAALLLLLLVQIAGIVAMLLLNGFALPNPLVLILWSVVGIAALVVNFYFFALLAMIILSWIAPGSSNPFVYLLHQLTKPVMAPFRRLIPPMGGMDFSPILVFIGINVVQIMLRHLAVAVGLHPALVIGL
ncbi:MAG: YggT family protein [Gammaproteobacteria bacterium]|nr:YggT family protein [Gammaproteobacteria bacterium]